MKEDQRNWFQRNWRAGAGIMAFVVIVALAWLYLEAFVFESDLYPAAWLRWRVGQEPFPAVDASASAQWSGEWDEIPTFWGAWDPGDGELQALPEEYLRLPLPRVAAEYVFIGGSLKWRGLDVVVEVPNTIRADLIAEYWDGQRWVGGGSDGTRRKWITLDHSGPVRAGERDWETDILVINGQAREAYWLRFSVTEDLSEDLLASASIVHNAPTLLVGGWDLRSHLRTPCQNRPGLKMIYVTVLDADGRPLQGVKVGFDTKPSKGIVYDHPDFFGLTDENGYVEWNHLGVSTIYNLFMGDVHVVGNLRTDFGYGYCGTGPGSWRPVNRPRQYSWDLELQQQ